MAKKIGIPVCKSKEKLLSRDDFRNGVFSRDNHLCVICKNPAQDAHHILERRLFHNGGYYLSNGASLCGLCHIEAEKTTLSVETIREKIGIVDPVIPDHFYPDDNYDKWGNIILPSGLRIKGELADDESVLKITNGVFEFAKYQKYPRTPHVSWSESVSEDDRIMTDYSAFEGMEVVLLEKMDGENSNLYSDYFHARSLDGQSDETQSYIRGLQASIGYLIPNGWRICCENLYAKHSIHYTELNDIVQVFSIWNEKNECLSWDDTVEWCLLLGLTPVPVIKRLIFDLKTIKNIKIDTSKTEGYVIRPTGSFKFSDFKNKVAKYVRPKHVTSSAHWKRQALVKNLLKKI